MAESRATVTDGTGNRLGPSGALVLYLGFALAAAQMFPTAAARAGVAYPDPGWDLTYDGDADSFGINALGALDGNWRHDQSDRWDGSAPGQIGPPPNGDSPGGVVTITEGTTTYLRIQDTGNPEQEQPDGMGGFTTPWTGSSNRRFFFGHNIEAEHPGVTSVLSNGITISFRARVASTGVLDDVYPDFLDAEGEIPFFQEITPWPSSGKGYNVKDDGKGIFTVQQNGSDAVGFALALDFDTPDGISGGLIMNNRWNALLPGTDRAIPENANVLPISNAGLLNWHEFWITIQDSGTLDRFGRPMFKVQVYADGSLHPVEFEVMNSFGAEFAGQFVAFGLPSTTSFGAVDIDFYSYKLGAIAPPPPPGGAICGDGVIEAGEDCDDGNLAAGDCCSPTCAFEPVGTLCNDADICSQRETCDGLGSCVAPGPPCDDLDACTQDACNSLTGCSHTPDQSPACVSREVTQKQRICIVQVLKKLASASGVLGKQLRDIEGCIRDFGKLGPGSGIDPDVCTSSDPRNRVARAKQKALSIKQRKCTAPDQVPDFALPETALANQRAQAQALALTSDLFGPLLADVLRPASTDKPGQICQMQTIKRTDALLKTMLKEALAVADTALQGSANNAQDLASALLAAIDSDGRGKIAARAAKLEGKIQSLCFRGTASAPVLFSAGECSAATSNAAAFLACLEARARCRACRTLDSSAGLALTCDQFDDGAQNGSCLP